MEKLVEKESEGQEEGRIPCLDFGALARVPYTLCLPWDRRSGKAVKNVWVCKCLAVVV